jgi:hypothetical protein
VYVRRTSFGASAGGTGLAVGVTEGSGDADGSMLGDGTDEASADGAGEGAVDASGVAVGAAEVVGLAATDGEGDGSTVGSASAPLGTAPGTIRTETVPAGAGTSLASTRIGALTLPTTAPEASVRRIVSPSCASDGVRSPASRTNWRLVGPTASSKRAPNSKPSSAGWTRTVGPGRTAGNSTRFDAATRAPAP